jgi:hypothetical protein
MTPTYIHPADILGNNCHIQATYDANFNISVVYQCLYFIDAVVIRDAGVLMLHDVILFTNDGILNCPA